MRTIDSTAHSPHEACSAIRRAPRRNLARWAMAGWIAPKDGVLNIWVAPAGDMGAARVITNDTQARHPLSRLGPRRHARPLHAGRRRHRGMARLRGRGRDRRRRAISRPLPGVNARIHQLGARRAGVAADRHQRPRQGLARRLSHRHPHRRARARCSRTRRSCREHHARSAAAPQAGDQVARAEGGSTIFRFDGNDAGADAAWWSTRTI